MKKYKVVMLGEGKFYIFLYIGRVGKTSLTLRYVKDDFAPD